MNGVCDLVSSIVHQYATAMVEVLVYTLMEMVPIRQFVDVKLDTRVLNANFQIAVL